MLLPFGFLPCTPRKDDPLRFVDKAFARRLESAEEIPQVEYARLYHNLRPDVGAAFEPICGGHMIFAGLNSPIGRAVGMGFDGPVKRLTWSGWKLSIAHTTPLLNSIFVR